MGNTKDWFCIITPSGFKHITANVQAVKDALELGFEVWHNQKRVY